MAILCIDIGNTITDYGLVAGNQIQWVQQLPTAELADPQNGLSAKLASASLPQEDWEGLAFCSVDPSAAPAVHQLRIGERHIFQLTCKNCSGLSICVDRPEEVGQDRLANAIAAQTQIGTPSIVIDMGTAVTLDIVTDSGYEGGIIAPGLEVMTRYLHEQTALLPRLDPEQLKVSAPIGKTTLQAMQLGCTVGLAGMIHGLLDWVREALKEKGIGESQVVITGGSRQYLPPSWLQDIPYSPHLTLLGLAEAYRRNCSETGGGQ